MGGDAIDHLLGFAVAFDDFRADDGVHAFHLVVNGFADVVQEAGPLGGGDVQAQFRRDQGHQLGHLDGVLENVLAEAVAEMQAAQQFDQFAMHGRQAQLHDRLLAGALDGLVHFLGNGRDDLLNAGGMDAAIQDEPFHGLAGDLAAHGIKTGKDDRAGGVVNEHRHAGGGLEGANVAAFAADDAAFHFLALDIDSGGGGFKTVLAGIALDGQADDLARLFFGPALGVLHDVLGKLHGVAHAFLLHLLQEGGADLALAHFGRLGQAGAALGDQLGRLFAQGLQFRCLALAGPPGRRGGLFPA